MCSALSIFATCNYEFTGAVTCRINGNVLEPNLLELYIEKNKFFDIKEPGELVPAHFYSGYIAVISHSHLPYPKDRLYYNLGPLNLSQFFVRHFCSCRDP